MSTSITVLNSCVSLAETILGSPCDWAGSSFAEIAVMPDGGMLPDGTTAISWKTLNGLAGASCIICRPYIDPATGQRWHWGVWNLWRNLYKNWVLTGKEILKVRFYTNHPEVPFKIQFATGENGWAVYDMVNIPVNTLPANAWTEIKVDLRISQVDGSMPNLTMGAGVSATVTSDVAFPSQAVANEYYLLIDYMTVEPATTTIPLLARITPTSARVQISKTIAFNCVATGGTTGAYSYSWFIDNIQQGTTASTLLYVPTIVGTHTIYAVVNDGVETVTTSLATVEVVAQLPPPIPTRSLHCEGKYIKNDLGQTIMLHGVNAHHFFDGPYGSFLDSTGTMRYSASAPNFAAQIPYIQEEIEGLRTWGFNIVITIFSVELWLTNLDGYRDNIKTFIDMCAANGLYVVLAGYSIQWYETGGRLTPLPYPPNLNVAELATCGWTGPQDFINWWAQVASYLKDCNNVLFQIWEEPNNQVADIPYAEAEATWWNTFQQCITAIRAAGANQPVIAQWNPGSNYAFGADNSQYAMSWPTQFPLTDPANSIIYCTHTYREYMQLGGWWLGSWATRQCAYLYDDIKTVMTDQLVLQTAQKYPVLIGEIGANIVSPTATHDGTDPYQAELQAMRNALQLYNENGLHWCAFWWRPATMFSLCEGNNYMPTDGGAVVLNALKPFSPAPTISIVPPIILGYASGLAYLIWRVTKK